MRSWVKVRAIGIGVALYKAGGSRFADNSGKGEIIERLLIAKSPSELDFDAQFIWAPSAELGGEIASSAD